MDLEEAITINRISTQNGPIYLLIGWQAKSFETYIYHEENVWKGKFSSNRLSGFSKNLQMTESAYFAKVKNCLSHQREDYLYELKSGFFYWKRILKSSVIIEGFLPVELEVSPSISRPDLIEVLLALNRHLHEKLGIYKSKIKNIKTEYTKCLKDTQEFLHLKNGMEKALCDKFLNLLNMKKNDIQMLTAYNSCSSVRKKSPTICSTNLK
ncbi:uncharacterized protein LOC120632318 [Pararge aegeria]|uniref:uncharacterized protein LOC120632318 n=1 Tax=Pararge aegeria TaxID=116150 RepID=UPI0019D0274C|nr:uncharacterized protein LOC120632318 [Pararge aegeria]